MGLSPIARVYSWSPTRSGLDSLAGLSTNPTALLLQHPTPCSLTSCYPAASAEKMCIHSSMHTYTYTQIYVCAYVLIHMTQQNRTCLYMCVYVCVYTDPMFFYPSDSGISNFKLISSLSIKWELLEELYLYPLGQ